VTTYGWLVKSANDDWSMTPVFAGNMFAGGLADHVTLSPAIK
jgi:hypothetical protein